MTNGSDDDELMCVTWAESARDNGPFLFTNR